MRLNKKEMRQSLASPRESGKTNRYVQKKVSKLRFQKEFSPGRKKKGSTHGNQREGSAFSGDASRGASKAHISGVFNKSQTDFGKIQKKLSENNLQKKCSKFEFKFSTHSFFRLVS